MDSTQHKEAFIPEGMTIKGNISVDGDLTFAGNLDGNLDVTGKLSTYGNLKGESIKAGEIAIYKGTFIGDISCNGHMNIPDNSTVIGDINADSLSITGAYRGNVEVKELLSIGSKAIVAGNVKSKNIDVREGAVCDITYTPLLQPDMDLKAFFQAEAAKHQ